MASPTTARARVKRGAKLPTGPLSAAILLGAVATMAADTARDPDLFWHVRTGQWIWENRAIPKGDPFSWTSPGRKWIAHEWLTEVGYASLHSAFGWVGISVLSALIIVAGWMIVRATCTRLGAGPVAASVATLLAAVSSLHTWGTRPQMISLLFTALYTWLLAYAVTGKERRLLYAVPVMLLWVNLHGGYIFGIAVLWAFAAVVVFTQLFASTRFGTIVLAGRLPVPSRRLTGTTLVATIASTAATLVNPNGIDGFTYPFSYLGKNASTQYVIEWFAPDFSKAQYWPFALVAAFSAFALVKYRRVIPLHVVAVAAPFAFLAFQSVRNITQFAIVAAPLLGLLFSRTRPASDHIDAAEPRRTSSADERKGAAIVYAMIVGAVVISSASTYTASANERVQARDFPVAAVKELAKLNAAGDVRVFNQYDWGGYLAFAEPTLKVFVDGRPDMYGDNFVDRYMSTWWLKPGWQERLREDGVNTVIANPNSKLVIELAKDRGWKRVYSDAIAVILQRV